MDLSLPMQRLKQLSKQSSDAAPAASSGSTATTATATAAAATASLAADIVYHCLPPRVPLAQPVKLNTYCYCWIQTPLRPTF
jgi:hypothetical protein